MTDWYSKNLGDPLLADKALDHIKQLFLLALDKSVKNNDMAIFIRHESEGRLHCEVIAYFSPATATVASTVNAVPCNKPSPKDLGLLTGSKQAWSILFPEANSLPD